MNILNKCICPCWSELVALQTTDPARYTEREQGLRRWRVVPSHSGSRVLEQVCHLLPLLKQQGASSPNSFTLDGILERPCSSDFLELSFLSKWEICQESLGGQDGFREY